MTLSLFSLKINLLSWKRIIICLWLHFPKINGLFHKISFCEQKGSSMLLYAVVLLHIWLTCILTLTPILDVNILLKMVSTAICQRNFGKLSLNVISFHELSLQKRAPYGQQSNNRQFKHRSWVFFLNWNGFKISFTNLCFSMWARFHGWMTSKMSFYICRLPILLNVSDFYFWYKLVS